MVNKLFEELKQLSQVSAIALGGSRAGTNFDEKSDYDIYLYIDSPININTRKTILSKYCKVMELGNSFWEYEDNCILNNDIDIDNYFFYLEQEYKLLYQVKKPEDEMTYEEYVNMKAPYYALYEFFRQKNLVTERS